MSRPCKTRRVCFMPECDLFGPVNCKKYCSLPVSMTVEEFETIRLIDLEKKTQEECSVFMNIARTTVQSIYDNARSKIAECLVNQRELRIGGGNYELCSAHNCSCCHESNNNVKDNFFTIGDNMKIAVTYENGSVFQHFGHTASFKIYDVDNGKLTNSAIVDTNGSGHGALASFLKSHEVDTVICGGIGGGARSALNEQNIKIFGGVTGSADEAVLALISGKIEFNPNATCTHHEGKHSCSSHGNHNCGEHNCASHNYDGK